MAFYVIKLKSIKTIRCLVTAEPMLFFYFIATVISINVGNNLLLHKGCNPNATTAPDLNVNATCLLESKAQQGVSSVTVLKTFILELISLTFIMFAGPWSDNHGRRRRPLMFVPIFGQILCDSLNVLFTMFWHVSPTVTGIIQSVSVSVTGSYHCFLIGMFAYLSDITDETNRTMRMGFASAILPLGATIGSLFAGFLNVKLGFVGVFVLNIGINLFALLLGLLFVYDTSEPYKSSGSALETTFNPKIVLNSFKTVFSKRVNNKRVILMLMILATPLTGGPFFGEISLMYLYLRKQFSFNEIDFSYFNAYSTGIMLIGSLFSLGILSRLLKIHDAIIGLIATCFDIATALGFLLVTNSKYLLFVPPLEVFRGSALSIIGSIASKCVESHELGSMNSVKTIIESLSKVVIIPLYNIVYHQTLDTMPSAFFIISLCLTVPLLGCFGVSYFVSRNKGQEKNSEGKSNDLNDNSINDVKVNNNVGDIHL